MKSVIQIILIFLIIAATIFFNLVLIDIRFAEVDYQLGKAAFNENSSKIFGIVAKYELLKRRIESNGNDAENYEMEAKIQALLSCDGVIKDHQDEFLKRKVLIPIHFVLNLIRFTLGKESLDPKSDNKIIKVLEIGYFWERNRKYFEAVGVYNDVLKESDLSVEIRSSVLLHKAFCYSMMSEYEKSKSIYEKIINLFPNTNSGILAWKLLEFINTIESKRILIVNKALSDFEKAKQFYLLMDYRNAIKYFSKYLGYGKGKNAKNIEARFFKARSHEELGETEEAVSEYRYIIKIDKSKKWARESNRRMLMLGEFYNYKKKISQEAKKQLAAYQDGTFLEQVEKVKGMMTESSLRKELLENMSGDNDLSSKNEVIDLINSIGDLDLNGEKQRKKEMENYRKELIAQGVKSEVKIKAMQRKKYLSANPFRRPSFLRQTINKNVNQLRYIYNKRLRQGVKIRGKMVVNIHIDADGSVSCSTVKHSTVGDNEFELAIINKIKEWKFRSVPDSLGTLKINYPFDFFEEQ